MTSEKIEAKGREIIEMFAETIRPVVYGNILERDWEKAHACGVHLCDEMIKNQKWFYSKHYSSTIDMGVTMAYSENIKYWTKIKEFILTQ